jgi:DNA-directed RNA polymerase specialized sigma24 family protein
MNFCLHGYLILPTDLTLLKTDSGVSPYCLRCWEQYAHLLTKCFHERPAIAEPCKYGFCNLIKQIVSQRGFTRDADGQEDKQLELRLRLLEKERVITPALAGKDKAYQENYIRRLLKNKLINDQTSSEGQVIQHSVKSLSPDGSRTDRKYLGANDARSFLMDETGGDSAAEQDDRSLDEKDALAYEATDTEQPKPKKGKKTTEARRLFDAMAAEASSQIATLTGGRKDGFETRLDLEKALLRLPEEEKSVFEALWLENGELLPRSRTYADVEYMLSLTTQTVRTLERKAIEKLRPALSPAFFKRRGSPAC